MKICFISPRSYVYFNPLIQTITGGAEKQIFLLATEFAKYDDCECSVIVGNFGQADVEIINNVKLLQSKIFDTNVLSAVFSMFSSLAKAKSDIYVFRAANSAIFFLTLYVRIILHSKVVYMVASDAETNFRDCKKLHGFLSAFFMKLSYKLFHLITNQSDNQLKSFYNYTNHKNLKLIRNSVLLANEAMNSKNAVIWVGRAEKIKRAEIYIELAIENPDIQFIFIFTKSADTEYWQMISDKAKSIKNVEYLDFVKPSEILEYYKKSKIYITTSEIEGFSNTMLEAISCNCAVLSLKTDPDDIIKNNEIGFCANDDIDLFKFYFKKMITEVEIINKFEQNCRNYIIENHSVEENSMKFYNELRKMI